MKVTVYIVELSSGLKDENGVELFHAVCARLTFASAEIERQRYGETARVSKFQATK